MKVGEVVSVEAVRDSIGCFDRFRAAHRGEAFEVEVLATGRGVEDRLPATHELIAFLVRAPPTRCLPRPLAEVHGAYGSGVLLQDCGAVPVEGVAPWPPAFASLLLADLAHDLVTLLAHEEGAQWLGVWFSEIDLRHVRVGRDGQIVLDVLGVPPPASTAPPDHGRQPSAWTWWLAALVAQGLPTTPADDEARGPLAGRVVPPALRLILSKMLALDPSVRLDLASVVTEARRLQAGEAADELARWLDALPDVDGPAPVRLGASIMEITRTHGASVPIAASRAAVDRSAVTQRTEPDPDDAVTEPYPLTGTPRRPAADPVPGRLAVPHPALSGEPSRSTLDLSAPFPARHPTRLELDPATRALFMALGAGALSFGAVLGLFVLVLWS